MPNLKVSFFTVFLFGTVMAMPMEASGMLANATVEQHLLNGIAAMVMSLNSSGMSDNLLKFPLLQSTNCITKEQRSLVTFCHNRTIEATPKGMMTLNDSNEEIIIGSQHIHHASLPEVLECILQETGSMDVMTGQINGTNLKETFISLSSLSTVQKSAARSSIDSCLNVDFILPHNRIHNKTHKFFHHDGHHTAILKTSYCAVKALIESGCWDVNQNADAEKGLASLSVAAVATDKDDSVEATFDVPKSWIDASVESLGHLAEMLDDDSNSSSSEETVTIPAPTTAKSVAPPMSPTTKVPLVG